MTMNKNFSHYVKQIRLKCTRDLVYLEVPLVKVLGLLVAVQADHLRVVVADVPVRLLGEEEKVNNQKSYKTKSKFKTGQIDRMHCLCLVAAAGRAKLEYTHQDGTTKKYHMPELNCCVTIITVFLPSLLISTFC